MSATINITGSGAATIDKTGGGSDEINTTGASTYEIDITGSGAAAVHLTGAGTSAINGDPVGGTILTFIFAMDLHYGWQPFGTHWTYEQQLEFVEMINDIIGVASGTGPVV